MYLCKLQKCICSNCKIYLFKQQGRIHEIPLHYIFMQITKMYLCKLQKCICSNCKIYLFKQQGRIHEIPLHYIFMQITKMYLCKLQKCICSNCKIYLFKQRGRIHEIPLSNQCRSPGVSRPCTCELEWQPSHKLRCPRPFSFYKRC